MSDLLLIDYYYSIIIDIKSQARRQSQKAKRPETINKYRQQRNSQTKKQRKQNIKIRDKYQIDTSKQDSQTKGQRQNTERPEKTTKEIPQRDAQTREQRQTKT